MRRGQKRFHTEGKVWKRLGNHSADRQDEAINPLAQYGFRAEERSLCDLILAGARDYQAMQPAVEKHAKVVKVVAPDPRSRSSSSVSNDSADDEDNEDDGVRNCRRYMSPARKVVKVAAPDPRSRSSSSFSNDSADDEDNGVRNCRRYMSPARKVVKVAAPDPRSRSSSSFSNDSADDEDNGVRNCRRYMSPARKVVKVATPDPRSRSSSSFSNDSAEDEDNGVRNCRRYMSPASRRQYPGTAHSDNQAILAQRNSAFQSGSEVPNPALAYAELDDAEELQAIVNKCFHCVTLPSLQEVFFPSV